jgi:hypothetical protein
MGYYDDFCVHTHVQTRKDSLADASSILIQYTTEQVHIQLLSFTTVLFWVSQLQRRWSKLLKRTGQAIVSVPSCAMLTVATKKQPNLLTMTTVTEVHTLVTLRLIVPDTNVIYYTEWP